MLGIFLNKFKESLFSVLPVSLIVLILSFTPWVNLSTSETVAFCICSLGLVLGITLFNIGADLAMSPMGEKVGLGLTKSKNIKLLICVCFVMGVLITIAEPDLSVLANQVSSVINGTTLILTIGIGVGLFLVFAILKIVFKRDLSTLLMFFYMLLFAFGMLLIESGKTDFVPMVFDSGGVTTGPITVPFIMAIGIGVAGAVGGKNIKENSFGLIALCSIGPMLAVLILSILSNGNLSYHLPTYSVDHELGRLGEIFLTKSFDIFKALGLIVLFFFILQFAVLKLPKERLIKIGVGIGFTFFGLVIFLVSVDVAFMPIGFKIGSELASLKNSVTIFGRAVQLGELILPIFGFILGAVVVLAEPALHVLKKQVEEITGGLVSQKSMVIALCIGVGLAICLSMLRIVFNFSILWYLIPGYLLSFLLSLFVPKIYTAVAFDSGGVASGPLTSSFILPLAIGACSSLWGEAYVLSSAFGIVAMVAMTPLITIQILGFKSVASRSIQHKIDMKRITQVNDEQIITFK